MAGIIKYIDQVTSMFMEFIIVKLCVIYLMVFYYYYYIFIFMGEMHTRKMP